MRGLHDAMESAHIYSATPFVQTSTISLCLTFTDTFMAIRSEDILIIICAIILPPVAVFLLKRPVSDILINILLTFFVFWIGGIIHALYLWNEKKKAWF
ncbi:hypothetical protein F5880DRAFT_1183834 [Lentinula raphanica]|nr:hypothetical protein F5880DRAFT_1183834 [Lentinula raphanica]